MESKFVDQKGFKLISPIEPKLTERDLLLVKRIGNDNTGENKTKLGSILAAAKQEANTVLLHNNGKGKKSQVKATKSAGSTLS